MEILNVGLGEMVMIIVIALLVFGPERLPEVARRAARFINDVRKMASDVQRTFLDETQEIRMPLEEIKKDITSVGEPLKELRQEGTAMKNDFLNNTQAAVNEAKATPTPVSANGTSGDANHRPYKPNSSSESTSE
jgi:sec-independent protein translocase protein TatB